MSSLKNSEGHATTASITASHIASSSAGTAKTTMTAHASLAAADTTVVTIGSLLLRTIKLVSDDTAVARQT